MANTGEGGSGGTTRKPRRPPRRIPTAPPPRGGGSGVPPGGGGGYTPPAGGGSSSGGSGSSYNPYAAAQRKADAAAAEAKRKAQQKWLDQAATIQQQIDALKIALGSKGLRAALGVQLRNVFRNEQADLLTQRKDYRQREGSLEKVAADNARAAGDQGFLNLANRGRERANALSEATLQGAGESDLLAAQGASLRNWNANQADQSRAFYDTLTSVNSSLTDLNVDTRTGLIGTAKQANADRAGLWTDYFGNRSEILTQLGNALGQQAEYYGLAQEAQSGKGIEDKQDAAAKLSGFYFDRAGYLSGKAWKDPGVPAYLRNWKGAGPITGQIDSTYHASAANQASTDLAKPEGATLRKWAA
jgi:hypothetical protein